MTHVAFYFPGGYLPGQDPFAEPLAWTTLRVLEQAADVVVPVVYDSFPQLDPDAFAAGVVRAVREGLGEHRPDRVSVVGKSLGTQALRVVLQTNDLLLPDDTRLVWLTPVWRPRESWEAVKAASRLAQFESLYVVGLDDGEFHIPDRHAQMPGRTVAIDDADHRLAVPGDIVATLGSWRVMAEAVLDFATRAAR